MRRANTSNPTVWTWQERILDESVGALGRDDPAVAGAAAASGDAPEDDREDGAGEPSERQPLEPQVDGRGRGHLAVERGPHLGELCQEMGDEFAKAAYRGGCQSLPELLEGTIGHEERYRHYRPVSRNLWMIR